METINNELQTIATIMNKNLTTTILTLHNLGFDFTKSVGKQSQEVDEKVSQMMLSSLVTNVPATPNAQEEITQQPIEKDEKFIEYKRKYDEEIENKMKMVRIKVDGDKIHRKKYKKGETQTKRDRLHCTIMHVSGFSVYDREKFFENSEWCSKQFAELEANNEDEVRQLIDNYFECELSDKDENLEKILIKYEHMMQVAFKIKTNPKMR